MPILTLRGVSAAYDHHTVLSGVTFALQEGIPSPLSAPTVRAKVRWPKPFWACSLCSPAASPGGRASLPGRSAIWRSRRRSKRISPPLFRRSCSPGGSTIWAAAPSFPGRTAGPPRKIWYALVLMRWPNALIVICPAGSSSGFSWPGRFAPRKSCCCWMNPPPGWTSGDGRALSAH